MENSLLERTGLEIRGLANSIFGRPNLENAVFEKLKPLKFVLKPFLWRAFVFKSPFSSLGLNLDSVPSF